MASPDGSKFPKFADADVLIVLNSERTFQLHANVLRSCSAKFAELLPEDGSAKLTRKAISTGATLRWRLDLEWMGMGKGAFVPRVRSLSALPAQPCTNNTVADFN